MGLQKSSGSVESTSRKMTAIDLNIEKTLAAAYDPLKDPTSDGFVDLPKQAWKAGASGLDAANAAPDATHAQSGGFWRWFKWGAVALFFAIGWLAYSQYQAHKAEVAQIQNAPSGSPEIGASPKNTGLGYVISHIPNKADKSATDNIANKATNTPASDDFYGLKPHEKPPGKTVKKPRIKDDFNAEFDKEQARFEANLKKEFP
jgi:hypothetical protein